MGWLDSWFYSQEDLLGGGGGGGDYPAPTFDNNWLKNVPEDFFALQGSFDRKPGMMSMALTSGAPGRINEFEQYGRRLIQDMVGGAYGAQYQTLGASRSFSDAQRRDALAAGGLAGSQYQAVMRGEDERGYAAQLAGLRGDRRSALAQAEFDFGGELLNARNRAEQYYDSLILQKYLGDKAAQAQLYAADRQAAASAQGSQNALLGSGLLALGSWLSDERLKSDVTTIVAGNPRIVSWRWNRRAERLGLRGRSVGVIAQELERVAPELVVTGPHGYKMVLYGAM